MSDLIGDLIKTALGGLIGSGLGYLIWIRQKVLELRQSHDAWLRAKRFRAYKRLWRSLDILALYAPPVDVTTEQLQKFGAALRGLYFADGLLFSKRARDVFLLLQECISTVAARPDRPPLRLTGALVTAADVKAAGFPGLEVARLESSDLFDDWLKETKTYAKARLNDSEQPAPGPTSPAFFLLQSLASSLRTVITADLNSRDASLLQPGSSLE